MEAFREELIYFLALTLNQEVDLPAQILRQIEKDVRSATSKDINLFHSKYHSKIMLDLVHGEPVCVECVSAKFGVDELHIPKLTPSEERKIKFYNSIIPRVEEFRPTHVKCKKCLNSYLSEKSLQSGCQCRLCFDCRADDYLESPSIQRIVCSICKMVFYPSSFVEQLREHLSNSYPDRDIPEVQSKCSVDGCQIVMENTAFLVKCLNECKVCLDCSLLEEMVCLACNRPANVNDEIEEEQKEIFVEPVIVGNIEEDPDDAAATQAAILELEKQMQDEYNLSIIEEQENAQALFEVINTTCSTSGDIAALFKLRFKDIISTSSLKSVLN